MPGEKGNSAANVLPANRVDKRYRSMLEYDTYIGTHCLYCVHFSLEDNSCLRLDALRELFQGSPNASCPDYLPRNHEASAGH